MLNPTEPPLYGEFWYNARVFDLLRGEGNGRLEADFVIGLKNGQSHWLELNGSQHYHPMDDTAEAIAWLERQQKHDLRKDEFVKNHPPFRGLTLQVVHYSQFSSLQAKIATLIAS